MIYANAGPKPKSLKLLNCIAAILALIGAIYLMNGYENYSLYIDARENNQAHLRLVRRTWWGIKKETFVVEREATSSGLRWSYYKPQPLAAALDAHAAKPPRFPLPYRVTVEWLEEDKYDSN